VAIAYHESNPRNSYCILIGLIQFRFLPNHQIFCN